MKVRIIGAGLAGSEAAWQIANLGIEVDIFEMRPLRPTKAHSSDRCAELVCSNSFRGASLSNAVGLLKEELRLAKSLIMEAADHAKVPGGGALAVDREVFSEFVDQKVKTHRLINFHCAEITELPEASAEEPSIVASGPLTSRTLTESIEKLTGAGNLAFFDAVSPILTYDSINTSVCFRQSRYDKGDSDDYYNIPLNKEEYEKFVQDVDEAEKYTGNEDVENDSLDKLRPFEGCMPIEDMIERGPDTLRFGPFKPVGLRDPRTERRPYAVLQLRQDNKEGTLWSMVGMQTRMKRADQKRIFTSLPGLENAEFVRFGSVHRNTFLDSPKFLDANLQFRGRPGLFFAGQLIGSEGYVESTAGGLLAGLNAARLLQGKELLVFPRETAIGALFDYVSDVDRKNFQPMNISFGLMPSYMKSIEETPKHKRKMPKKERRILCSEQSLECLGEFLRSNP